MHRSCSLLGFAYPVACVHRIDGTLGDHEGMIRTRNVDKEKKANKVSIIVEPDAVVDPWAMMVHSKHAFLALAAVMGTWRLVGVTRPTISRLPRQALDFIPFVGSHIWLLRHDKGFRGRLSRKWSPKLTHDLGTRPGSVATVR